MLMNIKRFDVGPAHHGLTHFSIGDVKIMCKYVILIHILINFFC